MKQGMKSLKALFKGHAVLTVGIVVILFFSVLLNVMIRSYLGKTVDNILSGTAIWRELVAYLGGMVLLSMILAFFKSHGMTGFQHGIRASLFQRAYRRLLRSAPDGLSLGGLNSLLSNDVTSVVNAVSRMGNKLLSDTFYFIFTLAVIAKISGVIALTALLAAAVPAVLVTAISKSQKTAKLAYLKELERVNTVASDALYSLESVKANGIEDDWCDTYGQAQAGLLRKRVGLSKIEAAITAPSVFCSFLIQLLIVVVSGWYAATGRISVGSLFLVISLMEYIISPVMSLENSLLSLRTLSASLGRLTDAFPNHGPCPSEPVKHEYNGQPSVVLQEVSFSYTPGNGLLNQASFTWETGRCHFLVGGNGTGKSTLIKLICGVLQPQSGRILLCGDDASGLDCGRRGAYLSVMPQEPVLFQDSVLENIRLYNLDISEDAVMDMCKKTGIHDEIMALPGQYGAVLTENGGTLSGGQKQRIILARTLLKDAPILIFDEPTSALDNDHAERVKRILQERAARQLVFIVTHDTRIITADGNLVQMGVAQ